MLSHEICLFDRELATRVRDENVALVQLDAVARNVSIWP